MGRKEAVEMVCVHSFELSRTPRTSEMGKTVFVVDWARGEARDSWRGYKH